MYNIQKEFIDKNIIILNVYNKKEFVYLKKFTELWLNKILNKYGIVKKKKHHITNYHELKIDSKQHSKIFNRNNRHMIIPIKLRKILLNKRFKKAILNIGFKKYKIWNEKFGEIAFRLVRPNSNDGYPFTKKNWGTAKNVYSVWIPIFGLKSSSTIKLVKNSHNKSFKKKYFKNSKFEKKEMRLNEKIDNKKIFSPNLTSGEIVIFGPNILHSEDNNYSKYTRVNLEFRFKGI